MSLRIARLLFGYGRLARCRHLVTQLLLLANWHRDPTLVTEYSVSGGKPSAVWTWTCGICAGAIDIRDEAMRTLVQHCRRFAQTTVIESCVCQNACGSNHGLTDLARPVPHHQHQLLHPPYASRFCSRCPVLVAHHVLYLPTLTMQVLSLIASAVKLWDCTLFSLLSAIMAITFSTRQPAFLHITKQF